MVQKILSILFVIALSFCSQNVKENKEVKSTSNDPLKEKYLSAVQDAKKAEVSEISEKLTAISPSNKKLVWKKFGKDDYVKMVTWTSWDGYSKSIGKEIPVTREVWATAVPDLLDFCAKKENFKGTPKILRLEQLLGLPPNNNKTRFIELWVKPSDMFRPAPDAEIEDSKAELDFPKNAKDEHKKWIESLKASSYEKDGYPWTRLGYTYDWGNPESEVGLSEFVIQKDSKIYVEADIPNDTYCK